MAGGGERRDGERACWRWLAILPAAALLALGLLLARPLIELAAAYDWIPIDHRIYHCSVRAVAMGLDPYAGAFPADCGELRFRFVYPPAILALFAWLGPAGLASASHLLLALQALACLAIALLARRLFFPALRPWAALPLYLLAAPAALLSWLAYGNVAVILYALLLAGAAALLAQPARLWPFVAALAVAAAFKWILLSLLVVLPLTLGRRGILPALGLAVAMAAAYGLDAWRAPEAFAAYAANFDVHRQLVDLGGGLATLGFDLLEAIGGTRDLSAAAEWFARGLWAVLGTLLFALAWLALRRRHASASAFDGRVRLALALLVGLLLLPRLKDYDLYLLMPSLLFLLAATDLSFLPPWLRLPLKGGLLAVWAVLPYHTAVAILALALPVWLLAVWRGWLRLRPCDPWAALPPPLAAGLLSAR